MGKDQQPASVHPTIYNLTLTTAGTQYSQVLHDGTTDKPSVKKVQVRCRTADDIAYGYEDAGNKVTIKSGQVYWQDGLDNSKGLTIYITGTVNGQVAEIEVWN